MHSFSKRNLLAADLEPDCSIPAAKRQELEAETKQEFDWDPTKVDIGWLEPEYNPQYGADASQSTSKHVFETTPSDSYQSLQVPRLYSPSNSQDEQDPYINSDQSHFGFQDCQILPSSNLPLSHEAFVLPSLSESKLDSELKETCFGMVRNRPHHIRDTLTLRY